MKSKSTRVRKPAIAAAGAVALATVAGVPAITSGQAPGDQTITVQEKVQKISIDDVAPPSGKELSQGDRVITTQSLSATPGGKGNLYTDCTAVGGTKKLFGGARLLCTVTYVLGDGEIVAAGSFGLGADSDLAIVGGTGAYEGASGTVESAKPAKGFDSADLITISG